MKSEQDFVNEGMTGEELAAIESYKSEPGPAQHEEPAVVEKAVEETPKVEAPKVDDQPKMVDVRALQEARAAERDMREQIAKEREERARLEERTNAILKQMQDSQKRSEVPDEATDPLGYYQHKLAEMEKRLSSVDEAETRRIEAARQQSHVQDTLARADMVYNQALEKDAAIKEALDFSINKTREALQKQGYFGQQLQSALTENMYHYASRAPQDPADMAEYVKANARYWGWTAPAAAAPATTVQPSVAELAERQERHMSLGGVSGGEAPTQLDAKALAKMSDAEFNKMMSTKAGRQKFEEIMGG